MSGQLKLHLGCGSTVVPGWENIDRSPTILLARVPGLRPLLAAGRLIDRDQARAVFPRGIVRADVRRGLPYPTASARSVYSSHMLEHMPRWQALALLRECHRVLAPGGTLRIATPDLEEIVESYRSAGGDAAPADTMMARLGHFTDVPGPRAASLLRRMFTGAAHQWLYDARSLTLLFGEAGFVGVERRGYRESEIPEIALLEDRPESLIVEGRRP